MLSWFGVGVVGSVYVFVCVRACLKGGLDGGHVTGVRVLRIFYMCIFTWKFCTCKKPCAENFKSNFCDTYGYK